MNAKKGSNLFVKIYFKIITLILIMHGSTRIHAEHESHALNESRIRRSLTTICVEIKPSRQQEEPYLMCKGAHLPEYWPHHPLMNTPWNNFQNNFKPNLKQIQNNQVKQVEFPRYLHNFDQPQSVLGSTKQNLPEYITGNNQHIKFDGHVPAVTTSFPPIYGGAISGNQDVNKLRNRSFVNTSPFEVPNNDNSNEFNSRNSVEEQTFQHSTPINIPTVTPAITVTPIAVNQELELKEPTDEMSRRNVDVNPFTLPISEVRPQESPYANSLSGAVNQERVSKNLYSLPYADDPLMQQFYRAQHEPMMVTNTPREDLFGVSNVPRYIETLPPGPNHLMHVNTPRRSTMENQCNNFQNEAISVSVAPTHNYCNNFPPVPAYAFPPIIIALPSYNTMPATATTGAPQPYYRSFSATNSNPSHENFFRENECSHIPQPTEMIGLPVHPFINTLQRSLFPHFNMMPGLSSLLGSARKMLPAFHNTPNAFRSSGPITGVTNTHTLPNAPQTTSMESTKTMNNLNVAPTQGEENIGAAHLSNVQSTTVPTPTDVVEPSVKMAPSVEESSTPQHIDIESNPTPDSLVVSHTDTTSELKQISSTEAGESNEESTKKILTIIEKARRLQMRHRIQEE